MGQLELQGTKSFFRTSSMAFHFQFRHISPPIVAEGLLEKPADICKKEFYARPPLHAWDGGPHNTLAYWH